MRLTLRYCLALPALLLWQAESLVLEDFLLPGPLAVLRCFGDTLLRPPFRAYALPIALTTGYPIFVVPRGSTNSPNRKGIDLFRFPRGSYARMLGHLPIPSVLPDAIMALRGAGGRRLRFSSWRHPLPPQEVLVF